MGCVIKQAKPYECFVAWTFDNVSFKTMQRVRRWVGASSDHCLCCSLRVGYRAGFCKLAVRETRQFAATGGQM